MGWNKVWDTAPGAGWSHQVERGSNKDQFIEDQLIASLQEYHSGGDAKKDTTERRDMNKMNIKIDLWVTKPIYLRNTLKNFQKEVNNHKEQELPITEEFKKSFIKNVSQLLWSINDSLTQLENFIDNNWLSDDDIAKYDTNNDGNIDTIKKNFFADKRFDPLRKALHAMKEFDEIYDPKHQNTFLSRGINLRNLAFMGIKLISKTENTKVEEIGNTLMGDTK